MRILKKVLIYLVLIVLVLLVGGYAYLMLAFPKVDKAEAISIQPTQERLDRGQYFATHVAVCVDCHSERDWNKFSGPLVPGTWGQGGEVFDQKMGLPGKYIAKNITPYGLKEWTDGEVFRAITSGVSKDGTPLFPIMPHLNYGQLDREDIYDVIAYIRTLPPVEKDIEASSSDFPMNLIIRTIPQQAKFSKKPDPSDKVAYGKYLFTAASCNDCHTMQEKGQPVAGMTLAGGFEFPLPNGGTVRSANITPHKESGIGRWTEDMFVERFKMYSQPDFVIPEVQPGQFNSVMPWVMYSGMKEEDLRAIFAYLQTVEPIDHLVEKFTP